MADDNGVMTAVRWWGRGDVRVDTVPRPAARPATVHAPGEVIVEVLACGICGTDIEEYESGPIVSPIQPHPLTGAQVPITMGHEIVGRIASASDPAAPPPGTVVAVEGNLFCGECFWCRRREYPLCRSLGSLGQMGDGGLADYVRAPAYMCVPLPADLPAVQATLVEPLAVVVRALRRRLAVAGESLAIIGAGTLGLLAVQAARAFGARDVVAVDPDPSRRELAAELGADLTLAPEEASTLGARYEAGGPDWALESAGALEAAESAVSIIRPGGTAVLVGVHEGDIRVPMLPTVLQERTLTASVSHVWDEDFPVAVELLATGAVQVEPLITSVVPLSQTVEKGFHALRGHTGGEIKIVVVPDRVLEQESAQEPALGSGAGR